MVVRDIGGAVVVVGDSLEGEKSGEVIIGSVCKFLMPSRDLSLNIDDYLYRL